MHYPTRKPQKLLRPKQKAMRNQAGQMVEHIHAVVDKVGDPKLPAVVGFLGAA